MAAGSLAKAIGLVLLGMSSGEDTAEYGHTLNITS